MPQARQQGSAQPLSELYKMAGYIYEMYYHIFTVLELRSMHGARLSTEVV